jgi:mono/diheme cytochrome c family protein
VIVSTNCSPDTVYFVNEVLPVLQSYCATAGCHDISTGEAGVLMTDYVNIIKTGDVKPGKPKSSKLYKVVNGGGEEPMPPSGRPQLTSAQIDLIYKWIDQGAWNLACENEPCDTTVYTYSGAVWPTIQTYCLGCHSGTNPGAGILLTDYQHISTIATNPRFMGSITHTSPYKFMPQNAAQLSECRITQFRKWIEAGTPEN